MTKERAGATMPGRGYEYADLDDVAGADDPAVGESARGAGPLGFAGTATGTSRQASGIAVLSGDGLDTEPRVPMLPGSWGENPN